MRRKKEGGEKRQGAARAEVVAERTANQEREAGEGKP